jgi:hypothetical protein
MNDATAMNVTDVGNPQSKINGGDIGDRGIGTGVHESPSMTQRVNNALTNL